MKPFLLIVALSLASVVFGASGVVPDRRTQVYTLSEVDRPPKLMVMAKPVYPPELKQQGIGGEVIIDCVVDLDGSVRDLEVKSSTRKEFELPALQAVYKWKYNPGRIRGGEKVNVRLEVTVPFGPKK